jgi:hypothetical protein
MKSRKSKIIKIIKPYIKESLNDPWRVERLAKKIKKAAIKKTEQCDSCEKKKKKECYIYASIAMPVRSMTTVA